MGLISLPRTRPNFIQILFKGARIFGKKIAAIKIQLKNCDKPIIKLTEKYQAGIGSAKMDQIFTDESEKQVA